VLLGLSLHDVAEKVLQLFIAGSLAQRGFDVELEVAAKAWTQFTVTCEPKFIAAFTKMQIGHCSDEPNPLPRFPETEIRCGAIGSEFGLRN
jgi:hypothetical protein